MTETDAFDIVTLGDGCRLAYRFDGPAEAPVLLLSNSLGTSFEMWAPQMPALTQRFRVLRYDSRGHGRSDAPAGAYGMDRLGRDVVELLDALGLDRVGFCGLSKGGMVGQWLGARAPERLDRLVLANTAAHMGPPSGWESRIGAVRAGGMAALADAAIARWFTPEFVARVPDQVASVRDMLLATPVEGYAACCAAIRDMDLRLTAPLIRVPTVVIAGAHDPATPPEQGRFLADAIPGARIVELDTAHLSNIEAPAAFTAALLDALG
ncbi:3-oxoadipate enol-lactonase [Xanthobacter agilis]|uniref:3-oxoadipate enol-lactonase n=1 Tax=Xanthobacter agilis TaxID=47492 RepID=A0ABU0LJ47_XANAG|nr:3-oxoadipate enol-lactonase [Xanthobacter agilis]MDQ0507122.1 3-oxoadipate enol-lactonase [Xanthobacter agilis]